MDVARPTPSARRAGLDTDDGSLERFAAWVLR
jgi:hypothetical protein